MSEKRIAGHARLADLERFASAVLSAHGASEASVAAIVRALMHATRLGVDSHGIRLLEHYVVEMDKGRVRKTPDVRVVREFGAVASVDGDHGHGALATFTAMDKAVAIARTMGIGAVGVRNGSHFGAAGAYALAAAQAGMIGFATCNSDRLVKLHDGAERFHGTNPHAWAIPVKGGRPWLLDMATSSIPYNRVNLYRSTGETLPEGTASSADGAPTRDAHQATMLVPLGGLDFGFKGAGLAGVAEILSAVVNAMELSHELLPMRERLEDVRPMGAFTLAIDPHAFADGEAVDATMERYVADLRASAVRDGASVMAPGDREWAVLEEREREGVPIDPVTAKNFETFASRFSVEAPALS